MDLFDCSDGSNFAKCCAKWRPGQVKGAHEIAWSGLPIVHRVFLWFDIWWLHSVHDTFFQWWRIPFCANICLRFWCWLSFGAMQNGYPLLVPPMLIQGLLYFNIQSLQSRCRRGKGNTIVHKYEKHNYICHFVVPTTFAPVLKRCFYFGGFGNGSWLPILAPHVQYLGLQFWRKTVASTDMCWETYLFLSLFIGMASIPSPQATVECGWLCRCTSGTSQN